MSKKIKNIAIEKWRQFGFHYDVDHDKKRWVFTGSPFGLKCFVQIIEEHCKGPAKVNISDRGHFDPFSYLKIKMTDKADITAQYISGSRSDLMALSQLITGYIVDDYINKDIFIKEKYTFDSEYGIQLVIKDYGFDPASCDF